MLNSTVFPSTGRVNGIRHVEFRKNQWCVAAYPTELGRTLFTRTICGESILFWRTEAGQVTATSDRCVHRGFDPHSHSM